MNLSKTYAALVDGLDKHAEAEVGKFSSDFMTAMTFGQADKVMELVKEAMEVLADDDQSFDALLGALELAGKYGSPMEKIAVERIMPAITHAMREIDSEFKKTAARVGHPMQTMPYATHQPKIIINTKDGGGGLSDYQKMSLLLGAGGLALSAAPFVMKLMRKSKREEEIADSLRKVMMEHPELKENPRTPMYFQSIASMAPEVAAHPALAGNVLKTLHQIGPEGLSPKLVKELIDVQDAMTSSKEHDSSMVEAGKSAHNLGKILADVGKSKPKLSKEDD